jgi:DnaK suppressor protein
MSGRSHIDVDMIREVLAAELDEIERLGRLGAEGRKTVELDQTSVGRLSRMDALQQQALAQETQRRRNLRRQRIRETLERIQQDEFGCCDQCGEEIAPKRLALDWTVRTCVRCAS